MNTNSIASQALPNPYSLKAPLPTYQVELLLFLAVVCLALGLLLAQGRALSKVLADIERIFDLQLTRSAESI